MSVYEKWEVVGSNTKPRKPKPVVVRANGQVGASTVKSAIPKLVVNTKPGRKKKHIGPRDTKIAKLPTTDDEDEAPVTKVSANAEVSTKIKKVLPSLKPNVKPKPVKPTDLQSTLKNISPDQLRNFYDGLLRAGSVGDIYTSSWVKYTADALNAQLTQAVIPDPIHWSENLSYPQLPKGLETVIQEIILNTAASRDDVDVIGLSFAAILSSLPTLLLRGDTVWGYLLFLREMCKVDPDLGVRRGKTLTELMESYGNRKEVGTSILWVSSQIALYSDNVLKIMTDHILPYYTFKHYKIFIQNVLSTLVESPVMGNDNVVDPQCFEDFFEFANDPKRKREFEKVYPSIRNLAIRNLRDHAHIIFFKFFRKLGDKSFMPLSPYGVEVFEVLHNSLIHNPSLVDQWKDNLSKYTKETVALLGYLSKHPENTISYAKHLESSFIQSNQFAAAAVQSPELLRVAKRFQTRVQRIEAERRSVGFSWKMGILIILLVVGGIFYLDVTESGKGSFAKSQTGEFLEKYGLLDEVQIVIDAIHKTASKFMEIVSKVVLIVYEWIRPLLQTIDKQVQIYIPEVISAARTTGNFIYEKAQGGLNFLEKNVFIGTLSPANLRKVAKDTLTLIWITLTSWFSWLHQFIGHYVAGH